MNLLSFKDFLFEKKKDDEVEVNVTKTQQAYYKDLPKGTATKKKAQASKQADMDSDDPNAYKELPGDTKAKDKVKTSEYTKAYHKKFGKKNESVDESEIIELQMNEADKKDDGEADKKLLNAGPIGDDSIETALKNKQKDTESISKYFVQ